MKKKVYSFSFIIYLLLLIGSSSCALYKVVDIEVIEPGSIVFPAWVKNVTLVDNSLPLDSTKGHNTCIEKNYNLRSGVKPKLTTINITNVKVDSFSVGVVRNAANRLLEAGFFDTVTVWSKNYRVGIDNVSGVSLANGLVAEIAKATNADVVISLDLLAPIDDVIIREVYPGWYDYPTLEVKTRSLWNIYNVRDEKLHGRIFHVDTIFWEGEMSGNYKVLNLPNRASALSDAAWEHGATFADKLVPHWVSTSRTYFSSGAKLMRKVQLLLDSAAYIKVIKLMDLGLIDTQSKRKKAMYAHNAALAYELMGDITKAESKAKEAAGWLALMPNDGYVDYYEGIITAYKENIMRRLSSQSRLRRQFKGIEK